MNKPLDPRAKLDNLKQSKLAYHLGYICTVNEDGSIPLNSRTIEIPALIQIANERREQIKVLRETLLECAYALDYVADRLNGDGEMLALPQRAREVVSKTGE